jgi:CubicO group peptidase (beta-lactamase class C family)
VLPAIILTIMTRWLPKSALLSTSLALCTAGPLPGAQSPDSLIRAVASALEQEGLVGATWSLVVGDSTTVGAAGLSDARRGLPMSPDHRVQVASVTKTLVATGILHLATVGRISIDAPVARYLPDLRVENRWADSSPLRLRHLLDHTGGLDDARMWQVFSLRAQPDAPLRAGLVRDGETLNVRHRPGERFSYSNTGYLILGMVIESVTGIRYEEFLRTALLEPLGMGRSTFAFVTQAGPRADSTLAMGHYDATTPAASVPSFVRPANQFTTTAADMALLARFLMGSGIVAGRTLVDSSLLRAMGRPSTTEAAASGLRAGYGLGLLRRDRHGLVGMCHLGNQGNFRAALCLYPDEQRAFFVAYNVDPEDANFDRIDGLLVRSLGMPRDSVHEHRVPDVDPALWAGYYRARPARFEQFAYLDEVTGVFRTDWDGQVMNLRPLQGRERRLSPAGGRLFRATDRSEPSHVLMHSAEGLPLISDGTRTLERVSRASVFGHWLSAVAGILALLYLLLVGGVRSVRALHRGSWQDEPLVWPAFTVAALVLVPALYLTQPFLAIGGPTIANWSVAVVTAMLPLSLLAAFVLLVRKSVRPRASMVDTLAVAAALQWVVLLAFWEMVPLVLWR